MQPQMSASHPPMSCKFSLQVTPAYRNTELIATNTL